MKREKALLPADVRRSKTPLPKLPIIYVHLEPRATNELGTLK